MVIVKSLVLLLVKWTTSKLVITGKICQFFKLPESFYFVLQVLQHKDNLSSHNETKENAEKKQEQISRICKSKTASKAIVPGNAPKTNANNSGVETLKAPADSDVIAKPEVLFI